jgi:hypothetical protein
MHGSIANKSCTFVKGPDLDVSFYSEQTNTTSPIPSAVDSKSSCGSDSLAIIFGVVVIVLTVITIAIETLQLKASKHQKAMAGNEVLELEAGVNQQDSQEALVYDDQDGDLQAPDDEQSSQSKNGDILEDVSV